MASSKLFSGTGNPNGIVTTSAKPGDLFQDRAGGLVWIRTTASAPNVWKIVLTQDFVPPTGFLSFSGGLEVNLSGGGGPMIMPYAPGGGAFPSRNFNVGFGATSASSVEDEMTWVATRAGTLTDLRVNVRGISGVTADFKIRQSTSFAGPFTTVMSITGVTVPGSYDTAGAVAIAPGDRILFTVNRV